MQKAKTFKRFLALTMTLTLLFGLAPADMIGSVQAASAESAEAISDGGKEAPQAISAGERKIKINDDWRFRLLDTGRAINNSLDETASQAGYTEEGIWNTVQLPHDWSIYQEFAGSDSVARPAQGSLAGGTGWYRKSFTLSDDMKDKDIVLQFDAVQMVSEVWINGVDLGKQYLGYVTFEYDITPYLHFDGQENVIAVKAYSSNQSARWYSGAGIYGSVYLIATEKVHIPVNGIHVATVVEEDGKYILPDFHTEPDMDALKKKSTVNVRTNIENSTAAPTEVSVNSVIYSKTNPEVSAARQDNIQVPAGETVKIDQLIDIANPELWNVDDPNLYWVKTEIIQDGQVVDTMDTRFGIRYIYLKPGSFDAPYSENNTQGGLFINGVYTKINGVCEHRDLGALGMETYQAAIDRRIRKLKDMGVNVVRCAHNPVSPEYIEAADRLGMLIFEEGFDQWLLQKNNDDYSHYFNKAADGETVVFEYSASSGTDSYIRWVNPDLVPNCVRDIQAMVNRDKNSPSIFLWSTGNEIYDTAYGHGMDTQWLLSAAIKEIDSLDNIPYTNVIDKENKRTIRPTPEENYNALPNESNNYKTDYSVRGGGARYGRPISSAPPTWDTGNNKVTQKNGFIDNMALADIGGHNYSRATNQYTAHKKRYPNMCVVGTETVSAFYTRGVYNIDHYKGGEGGFREAHSSGYASEWPFNRNFVTASVSIREHRADMMPFLFGEMVWTGHDYLGEPTPQSRPSRSSYFGIIDTAGFEKDAFYMYRSAWTDTPTVHLLPQKWNWDMGTQVPVMVYTNAASVEVFINDKSIGVKEYDKDTANPVYLDYGLQNYQPGELKAVAKDENGQIIATDIVYTAGEAQSVELTGDRSFIQNDGSDLLYVEASVVDSAGNEVPTADNRITFHVEGGEIVALDNGDPRDTEPFRGKNNNNNSNTSNNRKAFNGKALAIIKATKGSTDDIVVTATASADGGQLSSNTLTVGAVEEIGDGTSIQSYDIPELTTGVGVTPVLPETVGVIYDNGLIRQYDVESWDMGEVDLNKAGVYSAYGSASGMTEKVEAKIHVKDIESIDTAEITTIAGIEPSLPKFVTVHYTDGELGSAQVSWEPIEASKYADEGIFDAFGTIGPDKNVNAEITVKKLLSIDDISLSTEIGRIPEMPTTVQVKFTDGTQEKLGVKWNISADDVKSAGVKKVTGTVLNSDVTAVAWINVSIAVYASDLELNTDTQDKVFVDQMVNGESLQARGMQGGPGEVYEKGIETKAPAEIEIDIAGRGYERFRSYVNLSLLNGGVTAPGAVAFEVYLDDAESPAFSSGEMTSANEAKLVDVDVTGASKIRLVTKSQTGDSEVDLADWVDAKFLSAHIAVDEILTTRLYTNNAGETPTLPSTVQAKIAGVEEPVDFAVTWLSPVTSSMFASGTVQRVYGKLEGANDNVVDFKFITDYDEALKSDDFYAEIGRWSAEETFDYPIDVDAKVNLTTAGLTPKLIYSATSEMIVENVQKYGFGYGVYPNRSGNSNQVVFAVPDLHYFQILNVASTADISSNNSFTFETSVNGSDWTGFTDFTKSDVLPGTGTSSAWPQRTYTSNSDAVFPQGTNFLRVTYPAGYTWQFNMTGISLEGGDGENTDLALFKLGEYAGTIDQKAKTVSVAIPSSMDVTNITPEILTSAGAEVTPQGAQDFTNPVIYTVSDGSGSKSYEVTVSRGVNVTFHPYGGSINGSSQAVTEFIPQGGKVTAPDTEPEREGYLFGGWTTDRAGKEPIEPDTFQADKDTVFYAIWNKNPYVEITADADATMKTWQTEKETNYGSDSSMLIRQTSNTAQYGVFGEGFTNTSTSDGTDIKTSLIRFKLAELEGQTVKSAKLALYYEGNTNPATTRDIKILVNRTDSDWNEKSVTWNKKPKVSDTTDFVESEEFQAASGGAKAIEMDVSTLYNSLAEGETDISFAVTANSSSSDFRLTSREGATGVNAWKAPRLLVEVEKAPDYMVTYDLNGGTGEAPIQATVDEAESFPAADGDGITGPDGKQFAGWNTKADGSGDSYHAGDAVVMDAKNLILYAVYKEPVTITPNEESISVEDTPVDLSALDLFTIDKNAGTVHIYSVVSGGTGKGRVDASDGKTLTVSRPGTIRIKLATSETDTHMRGEAIATLTVTEDGTELIPVHNAAGSGASVKYDGSKIDLSAAEGLFVMDQNAGEPAYTLEEEGTTGAGTIEGHSLNVTKAGVFRIRLVTAKTATHAAGAPVVGTLTVSRGTRVASAPTLAGKTSDSITLTALEDMEYSKDNGESWQTEAEFNGLTADTLYTFVQRYKQTDLYEVSNVSAALQVKTDAKSTEPLEPAVQSVIDKIHAIGTVTIEKKELIEEARKAYDALTEKQKNMVPQTDLAVLAAAEAEYKRLTQTVNPAPVNPAVGSKFKAGTLSYRIISISAASKTGTVWVAKTSANRKMKKVSVPNSVRYQNFTFKVTGVEKNAFKKASKLKTVKLGNNVKTISAGAFRDCKKIKKVTIGTGLVTIGKQAFQNDKNLKTVIIKSKKLKKVGTAALKGVHKNAKIKVPKTKLKAYKKKFKGRTNAKITK